MRRVIFILFLGSLMLVACNKNKNDAENAADVADLTPGDGVNLQTGQQHAKTQVATGDMREILLSLSRVHFGLDSSTLVKQARDALDEASAKLKDYPNVQLLVEGHTDERGTTEHNIALGERRANSVVRYMTEHGVSDKQLSVVSHGEEKPLAMGADERALAENRRVEFHLLKGDIKFVLEEGTLVDDTGAPLAEKQAEAAEAEAVAKADIAETPTADAPRKADETTEE